MLESIIGSFIGFFLANKVLDELDKSKKVKKKTTKKQVSKKQDSVKQESTK